MTLPDSNVWVALALSKHEWHDAARDWFEDRQLSEQAAFCRATQQSFLRLLTTAAVMAPYGVPPLSNKAAWSALEGFLDDDRVTLVEEPPGLEALWKKLASHSKPSPKLWMDAYLAAFASAGRHQLVTIDKAYKQLGRNRAGAFS